jgi:hypothetical protein
LTAFLQVYEPKLHLLSEDLLLIDRLEHLTGKLSLEAAGSMDANSNEEIPLGPARLLHGVLPCGLTYYVLNNTRPKGRAALALAVRVG